MAAVAIGVEVFLQRDNMLKTRLFLSVANLITADKGRHRAVRRFAPMGGFVFVNAAFNVPAGNNLFILKIWY